MVRRRRERKREEGIIGHYWREGVGLGLGLRVHMSSTFQRWFVGKRGEGVGGGSVDVSVNILESETAHGPSLMID